MRMALALAAAVPLVAGAPTTIAHPFTLTQHGLAKESAGPDVVLSETTVRGTIFVRRPLDFSGLQVQPATVAGEIVHRDGRLRLRLRLFAATLTAFGDGSKAVVAHARVVRSNDPACPRGIVGIVHFVDDARAGKDAMRLLVCPYAHEHYFDNGPRDRIRVAIG
jgi:hypothetical protein